MNLKEELEKTKTELQEVIKDANEMKGNTFALEMLRELKSNSKRWFIISVIELILLLGTNIGWLIYNSQFETIESSNMELYQEDVNNSNQSGVIN